jgi:RNA polymerase sigma-70 factor (ECF subfamily)
VDSSSLSDQELLARICQEDHQALGVLYDRYARLVFSIGMNILQDEGETEEMTQDVFVSVWRNAGTYRPDRAKVSTWVASIAHHRAIDIVRRRNRNTEMLAKIAAEALRSPQSWDGPATGAERSWERERVRAALAELPEDQRQALLLAYFRGLSHTEIARALDQPLGTVKTRIRLGVQKLRDRLNGELREGTD